MDRVLCAGELLWDEFDGGRRLGGAPANVAFHLRRHAVDARLATRVGADADGAAARLVLARAGFRDDDVQVDAELPTGTARVELDAEGRARYRFATPAAWDALAPPAGVPPEVLVHGTLAQRDPRARATIRALAARARERVYDLNLRPPWVDRTVVAESLAGATLAKLNEDELATCADWWSLPREPATFAAALAERHGPRAVCVTLGADGAGLWDGVRWHAAAGVATRVVDTVGAGDAFLAALLARRLVGKDWNAALAHAVRIGARVAGLPGAMPDYAVD